MNPINLIKGLLTFIGAALAIIFGAYNWGKKSEQEKQKDKQNDKMHEFLEGNLEISAEVRRLSDADIDSELQREDAARERVKNRKRVLR